MVPRVEGTVPGIKLFWFVSPPLHPWDDATLIAFVDTKDAEEKYLSGQIYFTRSAENTYSLESVSNCSAGERRGLIYIYKISDGNFSASK